MCNREKKYNFDSPIDRSLSNSLKWGTRSVQTEGLSSFSVADMDFAMDGPILEAMAARLEHPILGYEYTPEGLNEAFAAWQLRRHGFTVDTSTVLHLPGVVTGIALALLTLTVPGDGVVIQPPVYPPFFMIVEDNDRTLLQNPLLYSNTSQQWSMDLKGLERIFEEKHPKLMLLCSPHNPVGRVWDQEELGRLASLCEQYGVTIISDDIHADFVFHGYHYTPLAKVMEAATASYIQLLSPAKTFNMPGMGMAFAVVPDEGIREALLKKSRAMGLAKPNLLTSTAVEAGYGKGRDWFEAALKYIEENAYFFRRQIETRLPWVKVAVAQGTFLAWIDLRGSGLSHAALAHIIRREAKLLVFDGLSFGENGEYCFRLNLACPRSLLQQAVDTLISVLDNARDREPVALGLNIVVDKGCCSG